MKHEVQKQKKVLSLYHDVTSNVREEEAFLDKVLDAKTDNESGKMIYHCSLYWGYQFEDEDGQSKDIGVVEDVSSSGKCKEHCQTFGCECWTWIEIEEGRGECHLKDANNCEVNIKYYHM